MNKLGRRQFLGRSLTTLVTLLGVPTLWGSRKANAAVNSNPLVDCLILGAGVAGLAAAKELKNNNKSILILEGNSRIGGRIYTNYTFTDSPIELGAQFIHQPPGSESFWQAFCNFNFRKVTFSKIFRSQIYHTSWKKLKYLVTAAIQVAIESGSTKPFSLLSLIRNFKPETGDISAAQWLDNQKYSIDGRNLAQMAFVGRQPVDPSNLSMTGFLSDKILEQIDPDTPDFVVPDGYSKLVDQFAAGLPIKLNCIIEKIIYDAKGVKVITRSGEVYYAKTAICTFSTNMLKSPDITFIPPLPQRKTDALMMVEQGHETLVIMEFSKRFWEQSMFFKRATIGENVMFHRVDSERQAGRSYFNNFFYDDQKNHILTAYLNGSDAQRLKRESDESLLKKIFDDLDEMFPDAAPVRDKIVRREDQTLKYIRIQWMDDPFSRGGNSYISMKKSRTVSVENIRHELGSSVETQPLFWAGEATATKTQPGSVNGAFYSGQRAANEVISELFKG